MALGVSTRFGWLVKIKSMHEELIFLEYDLIHWWLFDQSLFAEVKKNNVAPSKV